MSNVSSQRAAQVGYRVVVAPKLGSLKLRGVPLGKGGTFTQADVSARAVTYTHAGSLGARTQADDSFGFVLFDQHGDITNADQYSRCMPEPPYPFPQDGVFVLPIRVTSKGYLVANPQVPALLVDHAQLAQLTEAHVRVESSTGTSEDILYVVARSPSAGRIERLGAPVTAFTLQQILDNEVFYHHVGDNTRDVIQLTAQNSFSKTVSLSVPVEISMGFAPTGPNVFYAPVNGQAAIQMTANRTPTVWSLINGSTVAPDGASVPAVGEYAAWSLYANSRDFMDRDPRQGAGFNKLPQYRNFTETNYWQGGLPLGVRLNSSGSVSSSTQQPEPAAGSVLWSLPEKPTSFTWQAQAVDPVSGNTFTRRYFLHVTQTGFGLDGQASERND